MSNRILDDFALEQSIKKEFGVNIEVDNVIADRIPISPTGTATVFLTGKKQLYCYIEGKSSLVLADIKKLIGRMGLKPEAYLPPNGQSEYFEYVGREKFKAVFPGRTHIASDDLVYYRTLAPYNPALVQISEIPDGHIKQYDSDARGGWRPSVKFAYRRIRTS
jgi:hypothetical protein